MGSRVMRRRPAFSLPSPSRCAPVQPPRAQARQAGLPGKPIGVRWQMQLAERVHTPKGRGERSGTRKNERKLRPKGERRKAKRRCSASGYLCYITLLRSMAIFFVVLKTLRVGITILVITWLA